MSLLSSEKPKFANLIFTSVGVLNAASAGAMGADTNAVTIFTATTTAGGGAGAMVESLLINTDDSAAVNVFIFIKDLSNVIIPIGIVNVPLNSGNSGTVINVDAIDGSGAVKLQGLPINSQGKRYIPVSQGCSLKAAVLANMTSGKKCHVTALGVEVSTT